MNLDLSRILTILGLTLNTIAALLLLWPYLSVKKHLDDDLIVGGDKEKGTYTQKKHLRDKKLGVFAFFLLALGFFLQVVSAFLSR